MSRGIYAKIKPYTSDDIAVNYSFSCNDHYGIYERMMEITRNDHEISSDAASWCELATIGEIYEFREGEIEIIET